MSGTWFHLAPASPHRVRARLDRVENTAVQWWAHAGHARWVARTRSVSFRERVRAHPVPADWRRALVLEQHHRLHRWETELFQLDHHLGVWPHGARPLQVVENGVAAGLSLPHAERVAFPTFVPGQYRARRTYLEPTQPGQPYVAILTAYDHADEARWANVDIGLYTNWQKVLQLPMALALALDVHTVNPLVAQGLLASALSRRLSKAQRESAEYLDEAAKREGLHLLRIAIAVWGRTVADLDLHTAMVQDALQGRVRVERVPDQQAVHLRFFQDVPPPAIHTPIPARNVSSTGAACFMPTTIRRTVQQRGIYLGTDLDEQVPVHWEMFGSDGRENANTVIVGSSGFGKTTSTMAWLAHMALQGYKIFMLDPTRMCERLMRLIGDRTACVLHHVNERMAINVLDRQSPRLAEQVDAVVRQIQVALGKPKQVNGRTTVDPYLLTDPEFGALSAALADERMYGAHGHKLATMTPDTAPRLGDCPDEGITIGLVDVLDELAATRPAAAALAERIRDRLLGSMEPYYNRATALRFDAAVQVNLFSFHGVKQERLPLIYSHILGSIRDYVQAPARRGTGEKVIEFIDEYFYAKTVPLLEQSVILDTKTGRGEGFSVITADQQAGTYYDDAHGAGAFITGNARQKFFFYTEEEADLLARVYDHKLTPEHILRLQTLKRGQCLAMLDQDVRILDVVLTDLERRALVD